MSLASFFRTALPAAIAVFSLQFAEPFLAIASAHGPHSLRRPCSATVPLSYSFPSYSSYSYVGWPYRPYASTPIWIDRSFRIQPCQVETFGPSVVVLEESLFPMELAPYEPAKLYAPAIEIVPSQSNPIEGIQAELISAESEKAQFVEGFQVPVRLLTPTSPDWADSAIQLTDLMIQQGDSDAAYDACLRMREIRLQLPTGIYLRHGILSAMQLRSEAETIDAIRMAVESGSRLKSSELPTGALRTYLSGDRKLDVGNVIDDLAKRALEYDSPNDLLILGAILRLDGQAERSFPIVAAARSRLPSSLQSIADTLLQ